MNEKSGLVSFVIPTLNRGEYVVRAVASCLRNGHHQVEVIVIDSSSDDGSFEALLEAYGEDQRVQLLQNRKGSGPTRSWLEGLDAASGEFVTFVWSDDLISPYFLDLLLPSMLSGAAMSTGEGKISDIDSEFAFPNNAIPASTMERTEFVHQYLEVDTELSKNVSPICSLFRTKIAKEWAREVDQFCQSNPLRAHIMWRSAIGPDLMLIFLSMEPNRGPIAYARTPVAQFSVHSQSITISTGSWKLRAGYWETYLWYIIKNIHTEQKSTLRKFWAYSFVIGSMLVFTVPFQKHLRQHSLQIIRDYFYLSFCAVRGRFFLAGLVSSLVLLGAIAKRIFRR